MKRICILYLLVLGLFGCQSKEEEPKEIVWEDQILYFAMIDRFADGDPSNNDQGAGEYDRNHPNYFQGGDLEGLRQHIDYLTALGVTGLWITPPVRNQWWNPDTNFTGYHGYWASHFEEIDPHFGDLTAYKRLSDELHANGLTLIQDVVVNHVGDYFRYTNEYDPEDPTKGFRYFGKPLQSPFDLNDARNPDHVKEAVYHFTPTIADFQDSLQMETWQLSELDDINTDNLHVRSVLRKAYNYWIQEAKVDGYRFDTPLYVSHDFWHDFLYNPSDKHKGIEVFAPTVGKTNFYTFGETWVHDDAYEQQGLQRAAAYLGTKEQPEMDGVLNFPLLEEIQRVFAGGHSTDAMTQRLAYLDKWLPNPTSRLNFIDNHDMPRFRSQASEGAYRQAMLFIMSIPGVPVIYQGTELGEREARGFIGDKLETEGEEFRFIQDLIRFRKEHQATRNGKLTVLADSKRCKNLFVYQLTDEEEELIVAFNTAKHSILAAHIPVPLKYGVGAFEVLYELGDGAKMEMGEEEIASLQLPPRSGVVFRLKKGQKRSVSSNQSIPTFSTLSDSRLKERIKELSIDLEGGATGTLKATEMHLMMDGNWDEATPVSWDGTEWRATLDLQNHINGKHHLEVIASTAEGYRFSKRVAFTLELPEEVRVFALDEAGDDKGPKGTYRYPTDPTFSHQMDMTDITVKTIGNNLSVQIEMAEPLSTVWNPLNGFDHVCFFLFIDLPDQKGATAIPNCFATMPNGWDWDIGVTAAGWNTSMFNAIGANAEQVGAILESKPSLMTTSSPPTVSIFVPASALGNPQTLDGANLYLFTWDGAGEGDLRPLSPEGDAFEFGGGSATDPRIMDDVFISLP